MALHIPSLPKQAEPFVGLSNALGIHTLFEFFTIKPFACWCSVVRGATHGLLQGIVETFISLTCECSLGALQKLRMGREEDYDPHRL